MKCDINELKERMVASFVVGLKYVISSIIELEEFDTFL